MTHARRDVKITGLGPVTPAGIGRAAFWRGIHEPTSRVRELTRLDSGAGPFVGAEIVGFRLNDYLPGYGGKRLPRQTQFALVGVTLALADAGIDIEDLEGLDPLVVCGCTLIDADLTNRTVEGVMSRGPRAALPSVISEAPTSAIGGRVANLLKTQCRSLTVQTACCAGLDAIGQGADMVATGQAEIAICCGTEAPLYLHPMIELGAAGLAPRNAKDPASMGRPFDLWRNCGVIGEGAGVVILEAANSPREAYAWISGYAYRNDDAGLPGNGLRGSMEMALANARRHPEEVDLIYAWGPGHIQIDRAEAKALCDVFGERLMKIPAVSLKGTIGTPLAASGPIQVVGAALTLKTGLIPPTVNWTTPDPECPLNLSGQTRDVGFNVALVNSHGVSGTNSTLILRRA